MGTHYCGVQGAESLCARAGNTGPGRGHRGQREASRYIGLEPEEPGPEGLWLSSRLAPGRESVWALACRAAVYLPRLAHHGWRLRACSPWMAACRLPLAACRLPPAACRRQGPDLPSRRLGQPAAACPALCFTPGCGGVWRQIGTVAACLYRRARSGLRSRVAACFTASPWLRIRLATVRGRWPGCCRLSGRRRASGRVH